MFGKKIREEDGISTQEYLCRRIQGVGRQVAGDRGGRAANAVTGALGLGRIDICDDPNCPNCS